MHSPLIFSHVSRLLRFSLDTCSLSLSLDPVSLCFMQIFLLQRISLSYAFVFVIIDLQCSIVRLHVALTALAAIVKRMLLDCDHSLPKSIAHGVATLAVASNGKFALVKYNHHVQDLEYFLRVSSVRKRLAICAVAFQNDGLSYLLVSMGSVTTVYKPTRHANTGEHTCTPDLPLLLSSLSAPAGTSHPLAARSAKACCFKRPPFHVPLRIPKRANLVSR